MSAGKEVVLTACPLCGAPLEADPERPSSRRKVGYGNHLRLTHSDLSLRERSELSDAMLRSEVLA